MFEESIMYVDRNRTIVFVSVVLMQACLHALSSSALSLKIGLLFGKICVRQRVVS